MIIEINSSFYGNTLSSFNQHANLRERELSLLIQQRNLPAFQNQALYQVQHLGI